MDRQFNAENTIALFRNGINMGQKNGAYLLPEANLLKKALDYFDPKIKEKPTFDSPTDAKIVAINLLIQGIVKAQSHSGQYSFSLDDAALLSDAIDFWKTELGKDVATTSKDNNASTEKRKGKKSTAPSLRDSDDRDDDEDEEIETIKPLRNGKDRV